MHKRNFGVIGLYLLTLPVLARDLPACPVSTRPIACCTFKPAQALAARAPIRVGAHIWTHDLPASADDIVASRPAVLRFAMGPWWKTEAQMPLDTDAAAMRIYVAQIFAKREAYYRQEIQNIAALVQRTRAETHLVIWEPPLTAAEDLVAFKLTDDRKLQSAALQATARFYVAYIAALSERGFKPDIIELSNEPDGAWNMRMDPALYLDLLEATRHEAEQQGVALPAIAGPGVSIMASLPSYLGTPEQSARLFKLVDHISVHAWDDRVNRDIPTEAGKVRALLDARGWKGRIIASEVSVTFPTAEDRKLNTGPTRKGPDVVANRSEYGGVLADVALGIASRGIDTLILWQMKDPPWDSYSYGVITDGGKIRSGYAAWQAIAIALNSTSTKTVIRASDAPVFRALRIGQGPAYIFLNRSKEDTLLAISSEAVQLPEASLCALDAVPTLLLRSGQVLSAPARTSP